MTQKELIELQHKYKLVEIEAERKAKLDVEKFKHECDLEMHRIRNADIKRSIAMRR